MLGTHLSLVSWVWVFPASLIPSSVLDPGPGSHMCREPRLLTLFSLPAWASPRMRSVDEAVAGPEPGPPLARDSRLSVLLLLRAPATDLLELVWGWKGPPTPKGSCP